MLSSVDEINERWLEELMGLPDSSILSISLTASTTMLSHCVKLQVEYAAHVDVPVPKQLFVKFSRATPDISINLDAREVDFYRLMAPGMPICLVPTCYASEYDQEQNRYLLILEDLSNTHVARPLSQIPPALRECEQIISAVAQYQSFWWDHPDLGVEVGTLPAETSIRNFCEWARTVYPQFKEYMGDRISTDVDSFYIETLAALEEALSTRLINGSNLTMFHGDCHIGNFLYPLSGDTACIIDWQSWGIEMGVNDLVTLMAMVWSPARRNRLELPLLKRYHELLIENGVPSGYSWERCFADYRLGVLKALFYPIHHWKSNLSSDIWWNSFERISAAAIDLKCLERLSASV